MSKTNIKNADDLKAAIRKLESENENIVKTEYKGGGTKDSIFTNKKLRKTDDEELTIIYMGNKKPKVEAAIYEHELILDWLEFMKDIEGNPKNHISDFICNHHGHQVFAD